MVFTIHELDRDGNPHRKLASTPFLDVAEAMGLGLARKYWPEQSRATQEMMDGGVRRYVICQDGKPYSYVMLQEHTHKQWRTVLVSDANGE